MAEKQKIEAKEIFGDAEAQFEEAQRKVLVEATREKLADIMTNLKAVRSFLKDFQKQEKELLKALDDLKTKGIMEE